MPTPEPPSARPPAVRDLSRLLATLDPVRRPGTYTFVTLPADRSLPAGVTPVATIAEDEGLSLVVDVATARARGWPVGFEAAWLTCTVHSALDAVGLTAAMAGALTAAGISANVVAGHHHDHLFVPADRAAEALAVLRALRADHDLDHASRP
ncbi:MAG: ACT domain-containing protein [Acidimicrobiia bacterium]